MRILVAGATGVVGRRAVPLMVAAGHRVTAVARSPEKRAYLARLGASPVSLDLFDVEALARIVPGHEVVVNLATHIPPASRMFMPGAWAENDRIRRLASAKLSRAALEGGATRYIQESFAFVYPDSGDRWIDELTPIRPSRYTRSVVDAERAAADFTHGGGAGVVLRFAGFYGPDSDFVRSLITFVRRGWAPIPGSPDAFFSSVSHDDAASAVVAVLGAATGVYNVVDDEPLRRRDLFGALADALGVPPPRTPPAWSAHLFGSIAVTFTRSLRISNRKLREGTGWSPKYPSARTGWPSTIQAMHATGPPSELAA